MIAPAVFTAGWLLIGLVALVWEVIAIRSSDSPQNTLSGNIWSLFGVKSKGAWIRRGILLAIMIWLTAHLVFGTP